MDDGVLPGRRDWMRRDASTQRMERIEAFIGGHGYDMHRHDTYAIGRTLAGVQSFSYRRGVCNSLPGGTIVLHPDEPHDGQAGTEAGFQYRMIYVEPAHVQRALGGQPLPFIPGGRSDDPRLFAATETLLRAMDSPIDPLEEDDALYDVAQALAAAAGGPAPARRQALDYRAAELARTFLLDNVARIVTLDELEAATGRDRWRLSRDFRALFGTSPYRYLTMRRLDMARRLIVAGQTLADAAAWAGFTDQAHMTRHFARTFGITPARWLRTLGRTPA